MTALVQPIQEMLLTQLSQIVPVQGSICESGVMPALPVGPTSGQLAEYGSEHLDADVDTVVRGDGQFKRFEGVSMDKNPYRLEKHGLFTTVAEDSYDNEQQPFDVEADATMTLSSVLLLKKELAFQRALTTALTTTESLRTNVNAAERWDAEDGGSVLTSFTTAQNSILNNSGRHPNKLICPRQVYNSLKYNALLRETFRTGVVQGGPGMITQNELVAIADVKKIYVPEVVKAQSGSGIEQLWGKDVHFLHNPDTPAKYQVAFGYLVRDRRGTRRVYKFATQNPPNGRKILVGDNYQFNVTNANAGYSFGGVIA